MTDTSKLIVSSAALLVAAAASAAVVTAPPGAAPAVVKGSAAIVVVTDPASRAASAAAITKAASAPAAAQVVPASDPAMAPIMTPVMTATLKPLDLSDMKLWNWNGKWMASEWANASGPIAWKYNHITQLNRADTTFRLDAAGAPQLQALNGTAANASGLWETDVTLPKLKDGLIVAPLWLYDAASADEIDFEFAGRYGLDVSLHAKLNGVMRKDTVRLFAGIDMSNQRKRLGIAVDQKAGVIAMYVDGRLVHRWNRSALAFFVSRPLRPWIEMWPASPTNSGFVQWAGKWPGLATGETLSMTVHGFGYTPSTT